MRLTLLVVFLSTYLNTAFANILYTKNYGNIEELRSAIKVLEVSKEKSALTESKGLSLFAQGVLKFHEKKYSEAESLLAESLKAKINIPDYVQYFLGLARYKLLKFKEAEKNFMFVRNFSPPSSRRNDARLALGLVAYDLKNYRRAYKYLHYLERRRRSKEEYPYILWNLSKAEIKRRRNWRACRYVRKLYAKFPAHELTQSWDIDLKKVSLDGLKPSCLATPSDQKRRIRTLQYAGESQKAYNEIQSLYKKSQSATKYYVDMIFARYLVNEGEIAQALKTLVPHYEEHQKDRNFLMLMAKASHRLGDNKTAISLYRKAHKFHPRSKIGRKALFQMAFLCYQTRDYDCAINKFKQYRRTSRSRYFSEASAWYMAWSQYLKGKYHESYKAFSNLKISRNRWRRARQFYQKDQIQYWKAVSLLKMNEKERAKDLLTQLAEDSIQGYYSVAARIRLTNLKDVAVRNVASEKNAQPELMREEPLQEFEKGQDKTLSGEELLTADEEVERGNGPDIDEHAAEEEVVEEEIAGEPASEVVVKMFSDPRFNRRLNRARNLHLLGFNEWSVDELYAIERSTRKKEYLKKLIDEYESSGAYHRSAYISEVYFSTDREKNFFNSRELWGSMYPQAFKESVEKIAKSLALQPELIWSIMRTESHFKPRIKSYVGALGLMQVMPYTAERVAKLMGQSGFEKEKLFDPHYNVQIGARYIKRLSDMFDGNLPLVAAGYNAGPHRVKAWLKDLGTLNMDEFVEHIPFKQTRNYAKKIIRSYYIYNKLHKEKSFKEESFQWLTSQVTVDFDDGPYTKEVW